MAQTPDAQGQSRESANELGQPRLPQKTQAAPTRSPEDSSTEGPVISLPGSTEDEALPVELQRDAGLQGRSRTDSNVNVEQLLHSEVVSASKTAESSRTAPARIITISAEDIRERGYTELGQILDDLPSIDVARGYGPVYQRAYMRGYRSYPGENFLLMVDGVQFNQLYLNDAQMLVSFPVSNVHHVEVVYGPASVVYGANAAMGVINVITCHPRTGKNDISKSKTCNEKNAGSSMLARGSLELPTGGANFAQMTKTLDGTFSFHDQLFGHELLLQVAGRFSYGSLDPSISENFEYTKNRYLTDERLYGEYLNEPDLAGKFNSRIEQQGLDARVYLGNLELALQYYRRSTGQGTTWAADRAQANSPWTTVEKSAYARYSHQLSGRLDSVTMFRVRASNIEEPSTWLSRFADSENGPYDYLPPPTADGAQANLSQWRSTNSAYIATQEFGWSIPEKILPGASEAKFSFGLRYEHRDYDKDYISRYPWLDEAGPGGAISPRSQAYTPPVTGARYPENRIREDRLGGYLLGRYEFIKDNIVHIGGRIDYFSLLDIAEPSLRVGYVGTFQPITVKALYGQAFQEPTPRQNNGAFSSVTLDQEPLDPERSQTAELSVELVQRLYGLNAGGYLVNYASPIVTTSSQAINLGARNIVGLDFSAFGILPLGSRSTLKSWAYYSPIVLGEESAPPAAGPNAAPTTGTIPIGDIAKHKVQFGTTFNFNKRFIATVLGRWIAQRAPVMSNPLGPVPAFFTIDLNLRFNALRGVAFDLKGKNLLNSNYSHPGFASASSGNAPGYLDENNNWVGSQGFYNSRLPQPGRSIMLMLELDLESKANNKELN